MDLSKEHYYIRYQLYRHFEFSDTWEWEWESEIYSTESSAKQRFNDLKVITGDSIRDIQLYKITKERIA